MLMFQLTTEALTVYKGVYLGSRQSAAGISISMVIAVVGVGLVAGMLALGLNDHIAPLDFKGIAGNRKLLAVLPVGSALTQNGVQGCSTNPKTAGEGSANAILAHSQGNIAAVEIICFGANGATADLHGAVAKGIHAVTLAADGAAANGHRARVGIHAVFLAADDAAADGHRARVGIHAVFLAADDAAADGHRARVGIHAVILAADGAAANGHKAVGSIHAVKLAADGAADDGHSTVICFNTITGTGDLTALTGIGNGDVGTVIRYQNAPTGIRGAHLKTVQIKGKHTAVDFLIAVTQIDVLENGDHSLISGSTILHRLNGIIQRRIITGFATDGDGSLCIGRNRAADTNTVCIAVSLGEGIVTILTIPAVIANVVGVGLIAGVLTLGLNDHIATGDLGSTFSRNDHLIALPVGHALAQNGVQGCSVYLNSTGEGSTHAVLAHGQFENTGFVCT